MYNAVLIYTDEDNPKFVGYAIQKTPEKLQSINVYTENQLPQLRLQLDRLNDQNNVLAHWPHYTDPDVQRLVGNPAWEPVKDEPVEVVDEENSIFIWDREPDLANGDVGQMDEDASTIVTKYIMAPPPVLVQARVKKAQEIVARERMG